MKIQALFKNTGASAPAKKGTASTKVVKPAKAGGKATRGWLGGQGGAADLDKWYGESQRSIGAGWVDRMANGECARALAAPRAVVWVRLDH